MEEVFGPFFMASWFAFIIYLWIIHSAEFFAILGCYWIIHSDGYIWLLQGKVKDIELKGHTDSVDQLCWDPKHADLIATASGDKTVRLWDARSKLLLQSISIFIEVVSNLAS
jgi:WD40 repeat protein